MATIHYRNAKLFIDGASLAASLNELSVELSAEMLDATVFGNDTRVRAGGLKMGTISGKGFFDLLGSVGLEGLVWSDLGVDDNIYTVFADGVTEGTTTDMGFAMKGVMESLTLGGVVGSLLGVSFKANSRGVV